VSLRIRVWFKKKREVFPSSKKRKKGMVNAEKEKKEERGKKEPPIRKREGGGEKPSLTSRRGKVRVGTRTSFSPQGEGEKKSQLPLLQIEKERGEPAARRGKGGEKKGKSSFKAGDEERMIRHLQRR